VDCKAHKKTDEIYKSYPFPSDPALRREWVKFCGLDPNEELPLTAHVCYVHFPENIRHTFQCSILGVHKVQVCKCSVVKIDPNCVPSLYPPAFKYKYKGAKKMKIKSNSIER
jgi:hypothetical protein